MDHSGILGNAKKHRTEATEVTEDVLNRWWRKRDRSNLRDPTRSGFLTATGAAEAARLFGLHHSSVSRLISQAPLSKQIILILSPTSKGEAPSPRISKAFLPAFPFIRTVASRMNVLPQFCRLLRPALESPPDP
jgi:hypothetical protein